MIRSPRSLGFSSIDHLPLIDAQTDADAASLAGCFAFRLSPSPAASANAQQLPFAYARFSFAGNVILRILGIPVKAYQLMVSQVAHG
jgi:hypothetical protein